MKKARIYRFSRHSMQSGLGNTKKWHLAFEPLGTRYPEPLMDWVGSQETDTQLELQFESQEEAENYAKKNNITYEVVVSHTSLLLPKSYSANFSAHRMKCS
jgi:hypothetical protein